ncbi:MAG: UDP-2,3-diacylglucosamine diphosphatase LpxI [Planctomycetaceae bacterium]|jgi:DUF1009 family protein|nr:UDP-2,3-diacylglucosamine diphosphatase LpxI [Planctomycetaceae bacterium]
MKRVGIIAGYGDYPILLAKSLRQKNYEVHCLGVRDQCDPKIAEDCHAFHWMGFGQFGKAVRLFCKNHVTEAVMAGGIAKRQFHRSRLIWRYLPDFYTIRLFAPHFIFRTKKNTVDSLLLTCVEAFERYGIKLLPGTDIAPELLVKREQITRIAPTAAQWKDIQFGWNVAKEMGRLDVGQTITVKDRSVVAVEALEGTDECILRSGRLCQGFTVVKVAKPKQDMRFDLPCFGIQTLQNIALAGGKVIAIEADRSIFVGQQEAIDFAEKHGIAIVGLLEEDAKNGGLLLKE